MEEEVKYTSEFDGQTTDEVLKHAKSVKDLTIPSLSNISGFVCIDNEGKAIGMMSKEQVAQVVGGLLPLSSDSLNGLMPSESFTFSAHRVFNNSNTGVNNTLNFSMINDSCVMLRLISGRGDGQNAIIFLSICRNSNGVYSAKRMSFIHDKSAAFKSFGYVHYKGDEVYVRWGHYDMGNYQILILSNATYKGKLYNPSEEGFTEISVSDMIVNPTV